MRLVSHPPPLDVVVVVVVGAGLSGLICARQLRRQELKLLLLEARERCGGRMHGYSIVSSLRFEHGGYWVGASHQRSLRLLAEFGLRRYPTDYDVEANFHWQGQAGQAPRWPAAGPATWEGRSKRAWRPQSRCSGWNTLDRRRRQISARPGAGTGLGVGAQEQ